MLASLITQHLDGTQGGIGFEQCVVNAPGEGFGCALHSRDVDIVRRRAQGVGDGGVGAGEQFGVVGHVILLGWCVGFRLRADSRQGS